MALQCSLLGVWLLNWPVYFSIFILFHQTFITYFCFLDLGPDISAPGAHGIAPIPDLRVPSAYGDVLQYGAVTREKSPTSK